MWTDRNDLFVGVFVLKMVRSIRNQIKWYKVGLSEEKGGVTVQRLGADFRRSSNPVCLPLSHDDYPSAMAMASSVSCEAKEGGGFSFLEKAEEFRSHVVTEFGVQVAQGFVKKQEGRLGCESPYEGDPLLFATRGVDGGSVSEPAIWVCSRSLSTSELPLLGGFAEKGALLHRHVREEGIVLENKGAVPLFRRKKGIRSVGHGPIQINLTRVGNLKAGDDSQEGGLSAAASSHKGQDLAFLAFEAHLVNGGPIAGAEGLRDSSHRKELRQVGLHLAIEPNDGENHHENDTEARARRTRESGPD